jgi:hypothetical protein
MIRSHSPKPDISSHFAEAELCAAQLGKLTTHSHEATTRQWRVKTPHSSNAKRVCCICRRTWAYTCRPQCSRTRVVEEVVVLTDCFFVSAINLQGDKEKEVPMRTTQRLFEVRDVLSSTTPTHITLFISFKSRTFTHSLPNFHLLSASKIHAVNASESFFRRLLFKTLFFFFPVPPASTSTPKYISYTQAEQRGYQNR